ncbi:MAG: FAD-binding dehydrogenase, partial [Rhodobacteraceae bacterium]|nr:FAD-binding dehydrogenase [Paracoccaceae bacterium]
MSDGTAFEADVVVVGAGLAGLTAACEVAARGLSVLVLDQEGEQNLGGQAFWSLGGLFMVDTPEQRRMKIRDSRALAMADWMGSAQFEGPQDDWPRQVAAAYVDFAAGEMRSWLAGIGMRWFPVVGWAERGGAMAHGHGNSVPRFHVTWGTGPGVLAPFIRLARGHEDAGLLRFAFRHRVTAITRSAGRIDGVEGEVLEPTSVARGQKSGRGVVGQFRVRAGAVIVTSGGIGGDLERVRRAWPVDRLGPAPGRMVCGVPAHVDGAMIDATEAAGAELINTDRMWHYTEGLRNWDPIWPDHGIRILPGPSSLWFDALGERMEAPFLPGFDTLGTLK